MHYQFKQDLAMAYFDGCSAIETSTGCFFSLRPTGYRPAQKRLSPRQLQILFPFLGEP